MSIPFLWKGTFYQIVNAGIRSGQPYAIVQPPCQELTDILCSRIQKDKGLVVYLGDGFCCFLDERN